MEDNELLIKDLYAKYAPDKYSEDKVKYVQDNYENIEDFVRDFYGKYAPNDFSEQKMEYIRNNYLTPKKKEQASSTSKATGTDYGIRVDGTQKGEGFLGKQKMADGNDATELSIGVEIDGKEELIPTLIPTLSKEEKDWLLKGGNPSKVGDPMADAIAAKAIDFAKERKKEGKPFFVEQVIKFTPEENGKSRYEQAGDPLLPIVVKNSQKRLEQLKAELEKEELDLVDSSRGGMVDGLRPKNPQRIKSLNAEIKALSEAIGIQSEKKTKIDAEYNAQMLGTTLGDTTKLMELEKNLEGTAVDFLSRTAAKLIKAATGIPQSLPINDAERKQRAKYELENQVNTQIDQIHDTAVSKQREFDEIAKTVKAEAEKNIEQLNAAYEGGEIDYDTYKKQYQSLVKEFEGGMASLEQGYSKYVSTLKEFEGALNNLKIIAAYDNQSWLEANAKEFGNEWIKTPRQVAGLMKAVSSLIDLSNRTNPAVKGILNATTIGAAVNTLGYIKPEQYLDAVSPLTDWLTERTENNEFRVDRQKDVMLGQVAGQLSKIIPANVAAPIAGQLVMAGMSFDEMYQEAKAVQGVSEQEAINMASIYTPIGMALEYYGAKTGIEALAKKQLRNTAIRIIKEGGLTELGKKGARIELANGLLSEISENAVKEFFEEGITEALQSASMEGIKQAKNLQRGETIFKTDLNNFVDKLTQSFIYGGLAGAGAATVFTTIGMGGKNPSTFDAYRDILTDPTAVGALREKISRDRMLTETERTQALANLERDIETINSLTGLDLPLSKQKKAAELITRKKVIEEAIKGKDEGLTKELREEVKAINERLAALNPKVEAKNALKEEINENAEVQVEAEQPPVPEAGRIKTIDEDLEIGDTVELDVKPRQQAPTEEDTEKAAEEADQDLIRQQEELEKEFEEYDMALEMGAIDDSFIDELDLDASNAYFENEMDKLKADQIEEAGDVFMFLNQNLGRIRPQDFDKYGDVNIRKGNKGFAIQFLSSKATPLDVLLLELSEAFGREITTSDVIEFIQDKILHPDKYKKSKSHIKKLRSASRITDTAKAFDLYQNLGNNEDSFREIDRLEEMEVISPEQARIIKKYLTLRDETQKRQQSKLNPGGSVQQFNETDTGSQKDATQEKTEVAKPAKPKLSLSPLKLSEIQSIKNTKSMEKAAEQNEMVKAEYKKLKSLIDCLWKTKA
jgi:hypothetical protein